MADNADYFSDLLAPGEAIVASIAGPGPAVQRRVGEEQVWYQLAVTPTRLLVVRLVKGPMGTTYQPANRFAVDKHYIRVARFPRTHISHARLTITGAGDRVELLDIDDPTIFPTVEPFLVAWGGTVEGGGQVHMAELDPEAEARHDTRKLLIVMGVGLGLMILCCGCSSLIGLIRAYLL